MDEEIIEIRETYRQADTVEVVSGSLSGIRGVVRFYMPAKERITVLLEFLGRESEVVLDEAMVLPDKIHPLVG